MKIQFRLSDSNADQYSRHIHTSCIIFDEAQIWLACGSYVQFPHVRMFHIGISPKYIALFILPYLISLGCCWISSLANTTIIWVNFLGHKIKINKFKTRKYSLHVHLHQSISRACHPNITMYIGLFSILNCIIRYYIDVKFTLN